MKTEPKVKLIRLGFALVFLVFWAMSASVSAQPALMVDVPNGGEVWGGGDPRFIVWHGSHAAASPVKIELSTDGGSSWSTVAASTPNDGSYEWIVPNTPSTQSRIRISDAATGTPIDTSDANFTITTNIVVDVPNGGEVWGGGDPRFIVWHGSHAAASAVKIELSTDGGSSWSTVAASTPNDGSYEWIVPNTPSTQSRIRISDAATGTPIDTSDANFTITTNIVVDVPNGGEVWGGGDPRFIVWHGSHAAASAVKIELSTDGGSSWSTVAASTPNDGSYEWIVPETPSTQSRIRISDVATGAPVDTSDNNFTIFRRGALIDEKLELEERYAYSLLEAMLSLVAMNFEHTGQCSGDWNANVTVSQNATVAIANIDDVGLSAADIGGPQDLTKGTRIQVEGVGELGDTDVISLTTHSVYDFYGSMALMDGVANLDGDDFDEHIIKDFWEVEDSSTNGGPAPDLGHSKVMDFGYELITKFDYPSAKWDQKSMLWRSNGGNGYILIEKHLIAPDPINNGCTIRYSALVGNLGAGFQTIGGEMELLKGNGGG